MQDVQKLLSQLGVAKDLRACYWGKWSEQGSRTLDSFSPINAKLLASISLADEQSYNNCVEAAIDSFNAWRLVPAPKRGEVVYEMGQELRRHRDALGALISWEMGKILAEGIGEVQEAIDIADFAVGLSRQLYGNTMHSERPQHRMYEQWHPLGPIGVISAFNFPVAVWSWNAMIALVCGNSIIWKPSELTPLTSIATTKLCAKVASDHGFPGLLSLLIDDDASFGKKLAADRRIPLISATGSCSMGRDVAATVGARLGRSLLELGGNNAVIIAKDADLELATRAVVFGAVGTAGQRCTTTRRLLIDKEVYSEFVKKLVAAYKQVRIGHPLEEGTLCGPLVNTRAVKQFSEAINAAKTQGGKILHGGEVQKSALSDCYVTPTLVEASSDMEIVAEETFAPILYLIKTNSLADAVSIQNSVAQGLSSAIFTGSIKSSEYFLSHSGSDCGIANVNIGTSGAEIGGAFGGEKDTGGGREAGSDSWKVYMRRQTNTINWGEKLPLAQGIKFE